MQKLGKHAGSRRTLNVKKASMTAIIVNSIEILAVLVIFIYGLVHRRDYLSHTVELVLIGFCMLIIVWGAVIDIYDALNTRKIALQTDMIEEAYRQLEQLNGMLRSQRHDFMNHLQVVYSLTDLKEYDEAMRYIERVYSDIQHVSRFLKTGIPALNALIAAKEADCAERGLRLDTQIESSWSEVPIPGWELCRVFGNLIDNARDALTQVSGMDGRIVVFLGEKPGSFVFEVRNNGPEIPADLIGRIFESGFSTKAEGRGNGLAIVREILSGYGGGISVTSDMNQTCFSGTIPRAQMP